MTGLQNLKNYKYNCVDKSLLSKYVLNPLHNKVAGYLPLSMAPNVITLLGLLCSVTGAIITLSTDPQLNNQKYPIVKLINAILLFLYQAFDAIDGKQARRLGMSTPLGQLFDHGCDALVCFFTAITLASSTGLGVGMNLYYLTTCIAVVYALCSYEEYYTDLFYLGYINGPSEGIFIGIATHLISYFFGTIIGDFFMLKYKSMSILLIICISFTSISFINSFIYILRNTKRQSKTEIWDSFMRLYTLFLTIYIYQFHANTAKYFYIIFFTFMFLFARITLEISYAHLKNENIEAYDVFYYVYVIGAMFGMFFEIKGLIYGMVLVIMGINYFEFAFMTIREICGCLGISCLKVNASKKNE